MVEGAAAAAQTLVQLLRDADVVVQGYDYVAGLDRHVPDTNIAGVRLGVVAAGPADRIEQAARRVMDEFPASSVTVQPHSTDT